MFCFFFPLRKIIKKTGRGKLSELNTINRFFTLFYKVDNLCVFLSAFLLATSGKAGANSFL